MGKRSGWLGGGDVGNFLEETTVIGLLPGTEGAQADQSSLNGVTARALANERAQATYLNSLDGARTDFGKKLSEQALGNGPSLVDAQLRQQQQANLAQQLAAAKSVRGVNPALMARQQQMNLANSNVALNSQAGLGRLQEQRQNQAMFQDYLTGQQQYQSNLLSAASGNAQAQAASNASAAARQDQKDGNMMGMIGSLAGTAMMAFSDKNMKKNVRKEGYKKLPKFNSGGLVQDPAAYGQATNIFAPQNNALRYQMQPNPVVDDVFAKTMEKINSQVPQQQKSGGLMGMIGMSEGGSVPGTAPVKGDSEKNDIVVAQLSPGEVVVPRTVVAKGAKAAGKFVEQATKTSETKLNKGGKVDGDFSPKKFLDALQATSWEYKDTSKPGTSEGRKLSVMAQDLEKAGDVGKSMVKADAEGNKVVDYAAGFGAILAAQTDLNKRLSEIETKYKKVK